MQTDDVPSPQPDLIILLAIAYRCAVDVLQARMALAGFSDARPPFGYVFRALNAEALTSTELAARLGITKQATLKIVDDLEAHGYLVRYPDSDDRRAKILRLSERGRLAVETAMHISAELEAELAASVGPEQVAALRAALTTLLSTHGGLADARARRARPVW